MVHAISATTAGQNQTNTETPAGVTYASNGAPVAPSTFSDTTSTLTPNGHPQSGAGEGASPPLIDWSDIGASNPILLAGLALVVILILVWVLA
jgi:hypothetical protein